MGRTAEGTHGKMVAAVEILESQYVVTWQHKCTRTLTFSEIFMSSYICKQEWQLRRCQCANWDGSSSIGGAQEDGGCGGGKWSEE